MFTDVCLLNIWRPVLCKYWKINKILPEILALEKAAFDPPTARPPSLTCSSICTLSHILNCCDLCFLPAWLRTAFKQSVFISRSILACDHFILAHWSFQTAPDNGADTELGHSWLLDPLHLQQESHCNYKVVPPPTRQPPPPPRG